MKSKEQLIIEHNLAAKEAEERANQVSENLGKTMRGILDVRRMILAFELRLMDENAKFKSELEAYLKKL